VNLWCLNAVNIASRVSQMTYNADKSVVKEKYFELFYHTVMLLDRLEIAYKPEKYDFLRIPYNTHIQANHNIAQTIGWVDIRGESASTFDPYE
jgi:hypothetical protein